MRRDSVVPTYGPGRSRRTRWYVVLAAVVLILNGVLVTIILTGGEEAGAQGVDAVFADDRAAEAVRFAEAQTIDLVSLDVRSGDNDVAALKDRTAAVFRSEFDAFLDGFVTQIRQEGLLVELRVAASGLSSIGPADAVVVVASSGTVRADPSAGGPGRDTDPLSRDVAMRVSLIWIDDAWRVSGMEVV